MNNIFYSIYRWFKQRYHGSYKESVESATMDQRKAEAKARRESRFASWKRKYSGARRYTPAPAIHGCYYDF